MSYAGRGRIRTTPKLFGPIREGHDWGVYEPTFQLGKRFFLFGFPFPLCVLLKEACQGLRNFSVIKNITPKVTGYAEVLVELCRIFTRLIIGDCCDFCRARFDTVWCYDVAEKFACVACELTFSAVQFQIRFS